MRTVALLVGVVLLSGGIAGAWKVTVNGRPTSDMDNAASVGVDSHTGSIFVAGRRQVSSDLSQFLVVKFASDGRRIWQEVVEGSADVGVRAGAATVAVDSKGFVFVEGTIGNRDSAADFVIMKIDGRSPRKRVLWTRVVNGFGFDDSVNAMVLTPDGGVAVGGLVSIASGAHNFYLNDWRVNGADIGTSLSIASNGDIVAGGTTAQADFSVFRFSGTGIPLWQTIIDRGVSGALRTVAISVHGDIIAGGTLRPASGPHNSAFFVACLAADGHERWRYESPRMASFLEARAIAFDDRGNPVVTGWTQENPAALSTFSVIAFNKDTGGVVEHADHRDRTLHERRECCCSAPPD